jgi:hypothetical protein
MTSVLVLSPVSAGPAATAAFPTLTISGPASVDEPSAGTATAVFTVRLSRSSRKTVRVHFETANGTASGGTDYIPARGTLTFKPRQRIRTISVKLLADTAVEDTEEFFVELSRPHNARIGVRDARVEIPANDLPLPFRLAADLKAQQGPAAGRIDVTFDAAQHNATFTLTVHDLLRDPTAIHIHSATNVLHGTFPSLQPLPPRNGTVTGTVEMPVSTILLINNDVSDFFVEVHTASPDTPDPGDLTGDLYRP